MPKQPIPHYRGLWRTVDRWLSNIEKDSFNIWREDVCGILEALDKDARSLAIQAEGTELAEQTRTLARQVTQARKRIEGSVPPLYHNR